MPATHLAGRLSLTALLTGLLAACAGSPARDPYRRAIPVYEEVEVPIVERRPEPRVALRFIPQYEEVVEPVVGDGGRVRERRCRRFVGYEPVEIPIGCGWKRVETGSETVRRLVGWRWADDPPWPCEIEALRKKVEAREARAQEAEAQETRDEAEEPPELDDLPGLED